MGRVMKKRYLRIVAMALVAVMSVLCIPGTFAKYSKEETYTVAVKQKEIKDEPGEIVFNTNKTDKENAGYTSPEGGYYAILVKGGNGGSGVAGSGSKDSGWKTDSDSVGKGGIMLAIIHLTENQSLSVTVGKTGGNAKRQTKGTGGLTEETYQNGTKKQWIIWPVWSIQVPAYATREVGYFVGADGSANTHTNYKNAAGGGGGSATIVFFGDSTPNDLIIVAGGGGGSSGFDKEAYGLSTAAKNWSYGYGGNGGSNINPNENEIGGSASLGTVAGIVYNGLNGQASNGSTYAIGYGGGIAGGAGATAYSGSTHGGNAGTLIEASGNSFVNPSGCGGSAGGIGGGGGGGFAGGGGGGRGWFSYQNSSYTDAAGGGGGGSSFVRSDIDASSMTASNRQALATEMMKNKDANGSSYEYKSTDANGWCIIKELSVSDMMKYGITVN